MRATHLQNGSEATASKLQNTYRTLKAVASLPFCMVLAAGCLLIASGNVMGQHWREQSVETNPTNWKRFVSAEGRFSILFPGMPTVSEQTVDHPLWKFVLHKHQLRTFADYGVMYADYPKSVTDSTSADVLLDEGAKGAVAEVNSQLLSISRVSVDGHPGRLLKERMPNGTIMHVKMILVGQRMYQVAITTPREDGANPETVGFYSSTAQKFLDSFELSHAMQDSVLIVGSCPPDAQNCMPVTEDVLTGRTLNLPKPEYPPIARAAHATGEVVVQVLIDEEGTVISAAAVSGHPLLQAASVRAARSARFAPTLVDNKPVKVAGVIRYNFMTN